MSVAADFTVVHLKYNESDTTGHQLFVKENASKATCKQKPTGRTLYVLNVPPYATEEALRNAFSPAGAIERVVLQEKPSNQESAPIEIMAKNRFCFKVAYVVFAKPESLKKLLRMKKINPLHSEEKPLLTGMAKWTKAFNERIPDPATLQQEIDQYMESYDKKVEEQKAMESNNVADEDGWVTVSKNNAGVFSQKQRVVKKLEKKLDDDRTNKELKNFYTFQIRESKKNDIISLRKKYDRDLKKMDQIKKAKRFKPY
ncbi:ribosomal RNA-processing protein 7 homolog A [Anopheles maculipalpis]|uniref:ribosomal RNA-processing protein 7 homolog A n=1 Tax=Anopheles maculipalpis TaxID=1496333 RepID=UPI0021597B5F|nr:ribosomal RNA-processing protein 7 homolog A [Anopheles maculipalpis]